MHHREWLRTKLIFCAESRTSVRSVNSCLTRNCKPANAGKKESPMKTLLQAPWVVRFAVVVMFSVAWLGAYSQTTTATLSGVVHDPTGAVVPQVKITLRNIAKGTNRATLTDNDGRYNLSAVEPGTYELR